MGRSYLTTLARFGSPMHFTCPICGGRAVRALSDRNRSVPVGEFWYLEHNAVFRARLAGN